MRTFLLTICGASALALGTAAPAQQWIPLNQRQAGLDARIQAGVRDGSLTRREAAGLHMRFQQLERLEARYRANGWTPRERRDLQVRFDQLSNQIARDRHNMRRS